MEHRNLGRKRGVGSSGDAHVHSETSCAVPASYPNTGLKMVIDRKFQATSGCDWMARNMKGVLVHVYRGSSMWGHR